MPLDTLKVGEGNRFAESDGDKHRLLSRSGAARESFRGYYVCYAVIKRLKRRLVAITRSCRCY